jgi:hypothetical protein
MNPGSCLCGAVRFEAGHFDAMVHCHCSMCRRHHGAMFATYLTGTADSFRWRAGKDSIAAYRSSARGQRLFCRSCGSVAPTVLPESGIAFVPAGNLEGDPGIRPTLHMFAASGADWFPITDTLPRYDDFPPGFTGAEAVDNPRPVPKAGLVPGHCLCGAVAWEFTGTPERVHNCHCSRCRRARGAAHATNAFFRHTQLRWLSGDGEVVNYALPGAKRFGQAFCRHCGSSVPRFVTSTGYVVAPCGSLDGDPGIPVASHIFVGSKAPWHEITDRLPQHEALPA